MGPWIELNKFEFVDRSHIVRVQMIYSTEGEAKRCLELTLVAGKSAKVRDESLIAKVLSQLEIPDNGFPSNPQGG